MDPWIPVTDPKIIRRLGKTLEEISELTGVLALIEDGNSGLKPLLKDEIADVHAQIDETLQALYDRPPFESVLKQHAVNPVSLPPLIAACASVSNVAARSLIQGLDGCCPESGTSNLDRFLDALKRLFVELELLARSMRLDDGAITSRRAAKRARMQQWEAAL